MCLKCVFPINTAMNYIHGHACIHDLMTITHRQSQSYEKLLSGSERCVWALHPFNALSLESSSFEAVCDDFGYTLATVEHPWNSLDVLQLWAVFQQFNWAEHTVDMTDSYIQDPRYIYTRWYQVLRSHIDSKTYWDTVLGR